MRYFIMFAVCLSLVASGLNVSQVAADGNDTPSQSPDSARAYLLSSLTSWAQKAYPGATQIDFQVVPPRGNRQITYVIVGVESGSGRASYGRLDQDFLDGWLARLLPQDATAFKADEAKILQARDDLLFAYVGDSDPNVDYLMPD